MAWWKQVLNGMVDVTLANTSPTAYRVKKAGESAYAGTFVGAIARANAKSWGVSQSEAEKIVGEAYRRADDDDDRLMELLDHYSSNGSLP